MAYHLSLPDFKAPARMQSLLQGACCTGSQTLPAIVRRQPKSVAASLLQSPNAVHKRSAPPLRPNAANSPLPQIGPSATPFSMRSRKGVKNKTQQANGKNLRNRPLIIQNLGRTNTGNIAREGIDKLH